MNTCYLGTEKRRQMDGTAGTRKCHGLWWEAGCHPGLGARSLRQWLPEPFLLSLNWEKCSLLLFHCENAAATRIDHIYHTVLKWPIACKNDLRPRGQWRAAAACLCTGRHGAAYQCNASCLEQSPPATGQGVSSFKGEQLSPTRLSNYGISRSGLPGQGQVHACAVSRSTSPPPVRGCPHRKFKN